jgi:hypothetical protein
MAAPLQLARPHDSLKGKPHCPPRSNRRQSVEAPHLEARRPQNARPQSHRSGKISSINGSLAGANGLTNLTPSNAKPSCGLTTIPTRSPECDQPSLSIFSRAAKKPERSSSCSTSLFGRTSAWRQSWPRICTGDKWNFCPTAGKPRSRGASKSAATVSRPT